MKLHLHCLNCNLYYEFRYDMCPRCATLPGWKPEMDETAEEFVVEAAEEFVEEFVGTSSSGATEHAQKTPQVVLPGASSSDAAEHAQTTQQVLIGPRRFLRLTKCPICRV